MMAIYNSESVLSYYFSNRPVNSRATFEIWRPTLLQMIQDGLPAKAAHAWMVANKEHLQLPIPASTTVRDWMSELRPTKKRQVKPPKEELKLTDSARIVTAVSGSESETDRKQSSPELKSLPEKAEEGAGTEHPDLYELPIAVIPEGAANETETGFREVLTPQFVERNDRMQEMRLHYQALPATQRSKLAEAAFARLDAGNEAAFISHYADIYVITRDSNATLTTWTQGILRGMRALKEAKAAR